MADNGEDLTPFWLQNTTDLRRTDRLRHHLSSLFFNSALLLVFLLVTAIFFLVFIVPSSLSFTSSSIFKPSSVKKSWDSFNIVLVLVAVIFGFLSKNKNEDRNPNDNHQITSPIIRNEVQKSNPSTPNSRWFNDIRNPNPTTPRTWYDNVDRNSYSNNQSNITTGGGGLRRTFSSYPDLCEVSPRWISGEDHWRFYDDTHVDTYRFSDPGQLHRRRSFREVDRSPEPDIKTIYEDPLESKKEPIFTPPSSTAPLLSPPSPPPASAPVVYEDKVKRAAHSVPRKKERARKKRENHEVEANEVVRAPATPPPPPPPPPPQYVEPRSSKSDRKRGGASATKEFLNSLYQKKRKNRSKSVDNFDALLHKSEPPPLHYHEWPETFITTPPPPPASLFQNLFTSKKARRKRNAPPPPPPPPPPVRVAPVRISRPKSQNAPITRTPAPKPVKIRSFDSVEENSNSGGNSPLIPIPPPPPPPPFYRKNAWKFVVQGDYVRIDSTVSSRSGSPEPEDIDSAESIPTAEYVGGDRTAFAPSPLFCPSPDVNTKAENFISKFRAGLKLEKINSFNKNEGRGLSNLGPGVGPS
ncbi:uncharacterized protein LOC107827416 [Nicotiana tabacum]|uniref:Serine/arginine repetitive matrix protein 1-like n=1 Tax=Nicotiana tabacum TaxID=4097 RepID=A0A1S4D9E8_TOBAC|nr:serine/arginine repetitive matrix protein 1 [Nicotiana tomentosiformis]XP_016510037.1 PREDICTED: serine/arginine repetitive matrix protein 1-like [Nicotiana tabacum]